MSDLISRQELLDAISQKEYGHDYDENTDILGLKYVDIIKGIPSVEPEKCRDCISRAEVLSTYADWYGYGYNNGFYRLVQQMKSVEPEQKHGKWIEGKKTPGYIKWNCSECGLLVRNPQKPWYEYCPKCGATMEGGVTCNAED